MLVDLAQSNREEIDAQSLLRISQQLNSTLDTDLLLDSLIVGALQLVGAESGCSGLRTPGGMVCRRYFQSGTVLALEYCWPPGHGLPGWLIEHKVPYLTNDALSDTQIVHELCKQFGVWSALSTPILGADEEVLGFFEVHNKKDGAGFTRADQDKLMAVSHSAAIAIQNAIAYRKIKQTEEALRKSERELSRANSVLRRANADLEQFAYSASHDLQEPIRNISIYGEILAHRYRQSLDAKGMEYLSFIAEGARRMEMLVKDLLAYAQSANFEDMPADTADTGAALERALSNLSMAIGESNAKVTCGKLPDVRVPELHLQHLFQNLIGNAIKYRKEEEPPRIQISAGRNGEYWLFSVCDNGIGIPTEYKEQVFGMFKRLHGNGKYSGTGIGLAICQKVVERHGGRIWVESGGPGQGSIFHFTLPAGAGE